MKDSEKREKPNAARTKEKENDAGTWSDGKLTTRIGRNSGDVRAVLRTFVRHGAPAEILTQGAPHLGTDGLIGILKSLRRQLTELGVDLRFGTRLLGLETEDGACVGVRVLGEAARPRSRPTPSSAPRATAPTTSTTRSRRRARRWKRSPSPSALAAWSTRRSVVEVNGLAYGDLACRVVTGNARTDKANLLRHPTEEVLSRDSDALLPVAAYRLAADVGSHSPYIVLHVPWGASCSSSNKTVGDGRQWHVLLAAAFIVRERGAGRECCDGRPLLGSIERRAARPRLPAVSRKGRRLSGGRRLTPAPSSASPISLTKSSEAKTAAGVIL